MGQVRLGELLLRAGLLNREQLRSALKEQKRSGVRLGQILVDHRMVEEGPLYDALAQLSGMRRLDMSSIEVDRTAAGWVDPVWARRECVAPVAVDAPNRTLWVAVSDPTNVGPLDTLSFKTGLKVKAMLATERETLRLMRSVYTGDPLSRPGRPLPQQQIDEGADPVILRDMEQMRDDLHGTGRNPGLSRGRTTPGAMTGPPSSGAPPPRSAGSSSAPPIPVPSRSSVPAGHTPLPQMSSRPPPIAPSVRGHLPRPSDVEDPQERAAVEHLVRLLAANERASLELQALFELCVSRGIVERREYLARLRDQPG